MISALEEVRRKLEGAENLSAVARAMKSLAAVRVRQARAAVAALEEYVTTVELALQVLLGEGAGALPPDGHEGAARSAVIVFGSDLGLAGAYNLRVADHAQDHIRGLGVKTEDVFVLCVGERVADLMTQDSRPVHRRFPAPSSISAITETVRSLLVEIDRLRSDAAVESFHLAYNDYHSGTAYRPHTVQLLPLNAAWLRGLAKEPWASTCMPTFRTEWGALFAATVREHLFLTLFRATAESYASENASRLAAMQSAEQRIGERIAELRTRFNTEWKLGVTAELLDLLTGYGAAMARDAPG